MLDVSLFPPTFRLIVQFSNRQNGVLQQTNTGAPVQSSVYAVALPYLALFKTRHLFLDYEMFQRQGFL